LAAPVAIEALAGWYGANTPMRAQWRNGRDPVDPASCRKPSLVAIPSGHRIAPPGSAPTLATLLPDATIMNPAAGHIGMTVGSRAERELWRPMADWMAAGRA